jgi:hypothetical protein
MLLIRLAFIAALLAGTMTAQDRTVKDPALADAELHFQLTSTRAVANLRSLATIEAALEARGFTLHPRIAALRLRIEAALDKAEKAVEKNDATTAEEETHKADGYLERLEAQIGG